MIEVKLSKKQFEFLNHGLKKDRTDLYEELEKTDRGQNVDVFFEPEIAKSLREWCIEKLGLVGFDKDFNLTSEGLLLQGLVDMFSNDAWY